jgi:hypothetical protein
MYAAIRRDSRSGMSGRELQRKYNVGYRTVDAALTAAWPAERKQYSPRSSKLDPCLIGDSGTGKSHLLIALGTEAAMRGYLASNEAFSGWSKTFSEPRLCAAIVDRADHGPGTRNRALTRVLSAKFATARTEGSPEDVSLPANRADRRVRWPHPFARMDHRTSRDDREVGGESLSPRV